MIFKTSVLFVLAFSSFNLTLHLKPTNVGSGHLAEKSGYFMNVEADNWIAGEGQSVQSVQKDLETTNNINICPLATPFVIDGSS